MSSQPPNAAKLQGLDHFQSRRAPEICERFRRMRKAHDRHVASMWLGNLLQFDDYELRVLRDIGLLSPYDLDLLKNRRPMRVRQVQP